MRVGLDLLYLVPGETGGRETYARELVPELRRREPALELVAFLNRDAGARLAAELGEGLRPVIIPVSARSRPQWALGELALLSLAARRARVDLLHSLANFGPAGGSFRRVLTIHDLQYRAVPDGLSYPVRAATDAMVRLAARAADRIIAVSASGRDEIVGALKVPRGRVDVIPNGVRPPGPAGATDGLRSRYGLADRPVAVCVATNLPHKNLAALIDGLALIPSRSRPIVVFAGHATDDGSLRGRAAAGGVLADVRLLGVCSTEELESLYALADCLVLPSLHEGFGLPVLEALARSVPVACSGIAALREVAGSAAVYFDPRSPREISAVIAELLSEPALSQRLREAGPKRAAAFSWSSAAAATLATYRRALSSG